LDSVSVLTAEDTGLLFCSTTLNEVWSALDSRREYVRSPGVAPEELGLAAATLTCKTLDSMAALSNKLLLRTIALSAKDESEEADSGAEISNKGAGLLTASSNTVWGISTLTLTSGALWSSTTVVNLNCDFMCDTDDCPWT